MSALKTQAIQTALLGDWHNAILLNQSILETEPDDIETLNRLAFAQYSAGDVKGAKQSYQKVLELDSLNPIALRNLKRLSGGKSTAGSNGTPSQLGSYFIEEPGKTKVIDLINVADQKIIAPLRSGEMLNLQVKRMKIFVLDGQKQYLGMLPDDLSKRLIEFIDGGNAYEAYVKTIDKRRITIFIRETKRHMSFKDMPSFISTDKNRLSYEKQNFRSNHEEEDRES